MLGLNSFKHHQLKTKSYVAGEKERQWAEGRTLGDMQVLVGGF